MMQPNTVAPTSQPQTQQILIAPAVSQPINNLQRIQNYKKILRNLGITELSFGVLSIIFGIIIIASSQCYSRYCYYGYGRGIGEGIWCGIWIIIAGVLGISCGKNNSSKCQINTNMGFSIVGAVFSVVLFSIALYSAFANLYSAYYPYKIALYSILCLISLSSMIILIVSATYCCVVQGCTCCSQPDVQPLYCGQVIYTQQPLSNQQLPGNQPLAGQFHQATTPGNQIAMQPVMVQPGLMQPGVKQPILNVNNPLSQNMQSNEKQVPQQNLNAGNTAGDVPSAFDNFFQA